MSCPYPSFFLHPLSCTSHPLSQKPISSNLTHKNAWALTPTRVRQAQTEPTANSQGREAEGAKEQELPSPTPGYISSSKAGTGVDILLSDTQMSGDLNPHTRVCARQGSPTQDQKPRKKPPGPSRTTEERGNRNAVISVCPADCFLVLVVFMNRPFFRQANPHFLPRRSPPLLIADVLQGEEKDGEGQKPAYSGLLKGNPHLCKKCWHPVSRLKESPPRL